MRSISILILLICHPSFAQQLPVQGATDQMIDEMAIHNQNVARSEKQFGSNFRNGGEVKPFYEWDKTGYLLMSDDDFYGVATDMKENIAKNLPKDVTLIVYTQSSNKNYHQELKDTYSQFIAEDKLMVLQVPPSGSNDFWTRDNTPVPVWIDGKPSFVDAQYYYNFEPDSYLKDLFGIEMFSHNYFYEGGNFITNSKGDCLVVNRKRSYPGGVSDTGSIPDSIFTERYGCKSLIRFQHLKGIGHADEVVKFMTDDIVITDTEEYVETLKNAGFTVHLFPEAEYKYETYINSLVVDNVLYVPIFGESQDEKALQLYEDLNLGFKIVPINSRELSTQGQGSIHCITMNYPPMDLNQIVRNLHAEVIR